MALIKAFTDTSGNQCDQSFWRATRIQIDSLGGSIGVTFLGWRDAEAFQQGLTPLAGAGKSYQITGPDFLAVASAAPVGESLYDVLAHATESYAIQHPDGFFQNAQQV